MKATWTTPAQAATCVESATKVRFGAGATNSRLSRSWAPAAAGSSMVVTTYLPRTAPAMPISHLRRSTVQWATAPALAVQLSPGLPRAECLALTWFTVHDLPGGHVEYPDAGLLGCLHMVDPLAVHNWK
ncbi:hypothetical protein [Streptomyces sp. NPDC002779]|uniref:hypothetical protein n=1 Tax=Streptomyces sp. NPDC002779 TaxID=3364664 RepID=UPI0036B11487